MVEGIAAEKILPATDFFGELSYKGFSSHVFCPQRPEKVIDDVVLHRGRFMLTPRSPHRRYLRVFRICLITSCQLTGCFPLSWMS